MQREWIGCARQNFISGRPAGLRPEAIVIHMSCGSLTSCVNQFKDSNSAVSAHYCVGRDGRILQFVEETDTAFHAGIIVSPAWKKIKGGQNPNLYTIGIEHEGEPDQDLTDEQYAASAALIADVAARWNMPLDTDHIVLHREIRASKTCPPLRFDRTKLLSLATKQSPLPASGFRDLTVEVELLTRANIRASAPSTKAPVARVGLQGDSVLVSGFTDQGERVKGNANWYRTFDGAFLWAGATDAPNPTIAPSIDPVPPAVEPVGSSASQPPAQPAPPPKVQPAQPAMAPPRDSCACGVTRIDAILAGTAPPLAPGDEDKDAVAVVQDLLVCQGFKAMPGLMSPQRGKFSQKTMEAIRSFQAKVGLPASGTVDRSTLEKLIAEQACDPRCSQAYLTLVLGRAFTGMVRVLSLTAQMEGVGKFAALNLNTDRAGLSFGLIQWAQRPGRLPEILNGFRKAEPALYMEVFAAGDAGLAQDLLAHVSRANGGVNPKTGVTLNPSFNLIAEPWVGRFRAAANEPLFQKTQVEVALLAFQRSLKVINSYAPELKSERALAFMLDVANQFGDAGARNVFNSAKKPLMTEEDLLEAVGDETVRRMPSEFKAGVRARRDGFLHTPFLSDDPFVHS